MPARNSSPIALVLLVAILSGCGSVQPDGPLKDVMRGKIFEGPPRDPVQEKREEESQRSLNQQTPPPSDDQGVVRFKVPL